MLRHPNVIQWLYAMWRMRRAQRAMLFSQRQRFFDALRPRINARSVIAWPNAVLFIRPADVDKALAAMDRQDAPDADTEGTER